MIFSKLIDWIKATFLGGKMSQGSKCPHCKKHQVKPKHNGSFMECENCHFRFWAATTPVKGIGQGSGEKCPHCLGRRTLQKMFGVGKTEAAIIKRCTICNWTGVYPSPENVK